MWFFAALAVSGIYYCYSLNKEAHISLRNALWCHPVTVGRWVIRQVSEKDNRQHAVSQAVDDMQCRELGGPGGQANGRARKEAFRRMGGAAAAGDSG